MKQEVFTFRVDNANSIENYLDGIIENKWVIKNVIISKVNGFGIAIEIVVLCRKRFLGIF